MDASSNNDVVAPYFGSFGADELQHLVVMSPYEGKTVPSAWARGSIRLFRAVGQSTDFVVTGPRLKILFGGCRWNKLVFASTEADPIVIGFKNWLEQVGSIVKGVITANPDKFKPGAKSAARFTFDNEFFKASTEPSMYADEIRMRLATHREIQEETGETIDVPDVEFFTLDDNYNRKMVEPHELQSGGYLVPLIKISYFRNVERFGLSLTVLKGLYIPPEPRKNVSRDLQLDLMAVENFPTNNV